MAILELARTRSAGKIAICGSAFVEIGVGLRGSLLKTDIIETLRNLRALTNLITEIPVNSSIITSGLELEQRLKVSNLFDCLHAATALADDGILVSDDSFYRQVPSLTSLSLAKFAGEQK